MRRWLGVSSHASPFFFSCASVHTIVPKIPLCQRKRSSTWNEPSSPFDLVKRCSQRTHAIVLIVFGSVACSMIHNGSVIQFAFCTLWLLCYRAAFCWHKKLDVVKRQLPIKVHSVGILRFTTIRTEQIVYSIVGDHLWQGHGRGSKGFSSDPGMAGWRKDWCNYVFPGKGLAISEGLEGTVTSSHSHTIVFPGTEFGCTEAWNWAPCQVFYIHFFDFLGVRKGCV